MYACMYTCIYMCVHVCMYDACLNLARVPTLSLGLYGSWDMDNVSFMYIEAYYIGLVDDEY